MQAHLAHGSGLVQEQAAGVQRSHELDALAPPLRLPCSPLRPHALQRRRLRHPVQEDKDAVRCVLHHLHFGRRSNGAVPSAYKEFQWTCSISMQAAQHELRQLLYYNEACLRLSLPLVETTGACNRTRQGGNESLETIARESLIRSTPR